MLKKILLTIVISATMPVFANEGKSLNADEALLKLKEGNLRFTQNKLKHPDQTPQRRAELEKGQNPFVIILSCSDSRVSPEIIFDQGLGDIFEIRNAGNVVDRHVLGSIEYAVEHLGAKLIIVMGHQNCGAVSTALESWNSGRNINSIIYDIKPAVYKAKKQEGNLAVNTTNNNIINAIKKIKKDKKIKDVKIIPAYYHLDSGVVDFN